MDGGKEPARSDPAPPSGPARGRLAIIAVATTLLGAIVIVAALTASSGAPEAEIPEDCLTVWNEDPVALQDGRHAYKTHDYRAALLARVSDTGELVEPDASENRCAVVFASPRVDSEPDFGVRVLDRNRWAGLVLTDGVPVSRIEAMQRDATGEANATVLPDGSLTHRSG